MTYPSDDCRPKLDLDALHEMAKSNSQEALRQVISQAFIRKAKSWAYESEYRHFIFLHGCEMIGPHYYRTMLLPHLKRIILRVNLRASKSDINRIKDSWQTRFTIEVLKAGIDPESYRLRI